jgi:hypothetical protein
MNVRTGRVLSPLERTDGQKESFFRVSATFQNVKNVENSLSATAKRPQTIVPPHESGNAYL